MYLHFDTAWRNRVTEIRKKQVMFIKETWFDGLEHSGNIGVNKQRRYQKLGPTTVKK